MDYHFINKLSHCKILYICCDICCTDFLKQNAFSNLNDPFIVIIFNLKKPSATVYSVFQTEFMRQWKLCRPLGFQVCKIVWECLGVFIPNTLSVYLFSNRHITVNFDHLYCNMLNPHSLPMSPTSVFKK